MKSDYLRIILLNIIVFLGLIIIGGEEDTHPDEVRLFKNRENMSFDDAKAEPDQKFSLGT